MLVRRCYISDGAMRARIEAGTEEAHVLAAVLPGPGSIMSGDFGEIMTYVFHVASLTGTAHGPKKWRLKGDRTKAASHSDVVIFVLPRWPAFSSSDAVVCSEVKAKSTKSKFDPIARALAGVVKDRASRLARTLAWLKERAVRGDDSGVEMRVLDRFAKAASNDAYQTKYNAVAVVCSSLVDEELANLPAEKPADCEVIVIAIDALKPLYTDTYAAVLSVSDFAEEEDEASA